MSVSRLTAAARDPFAAKPYVTVKRTSAQNIAATVWTDLALQSITDGDTGLWDGGSAFVVPAGYAGLWTFIGQVQFLAAHQSYNKYVAAAYNITGGVNTPVDARRRGVSGSGLYEHTVVATRRMNVGDYVRLQVYSSQASETVQTATADLSTYATFVYEGP